MSSMNSQCETFVPMLDAFVDNELDDSEKSVVSGHIQSCDDCRAQLKQIEDLKSSLAGLPRRRMSRDLADNLDALFGNTETPVVPAKDNLVSINKAKRGWIMPVASAAAVVVIALAGSIVSKSGHHQVANLPQEKQLPASGSGPSKSQIEVAQNGMGSEIQKEPKVATTESKAKQVAVSQVETKIALAEHHDGAVEKMESGMKEKTVALQKSENIAPGQSFVATIAAGSGNSKGSINNERPASSQLLALYEEDEGIGTDIGMTTDEDGLYAIKL